MTRKENTMNTAIDWNAAEAVAVLLGLHTRKLVAERDAEAVREWALRAARDHDVGSHHVPRASSYFELAVLVGQSEPELPDELEEEGELEEEEEEEEEEDDAA
jgi:hypothetical protein